MSSGGLKARQRADMGLDTAPKRFQGITTFQTRDDAPLCVALGDRHELLGDPGVIGLDQRQLAQRIFTVGIEARGDEDHLRREGVERWQPMRLHQGAHGLARSAGPQRQIDAAGVQGSIATEGVQARLEETDHQDAFIPGHDVFGAVAVVYIEIHDRHPLQAAHIQRMAGRHSDVVVEAKAHHRIAGGMVAGRAHGAKRIGDGTVEYRIRGRNRRPRSPQHGLGGGRTGGGVGVQAAGLPTGGHGSEVGLQFAHIGRRVSACQRLGAGQRGLMRGEPGIQPSHTKPLENGIQPLRALGVAAAHVMAATVRVGEQGGGHGSRHDELLGSCVGMAFLTRHSLGFSAIVRRMNDAQKNLHHRLSRLTDQISTVIVGKRSAITDSLCCLLAGGHLLIEDIPGVGKTTLAHALAISLGLNFARVQFTADLMPTDLLGVSIYERNQERFVFHPGPVFTQVLLADEINRAGPKTQSALLEAMEERQVSAEGQTRPLPSPFFVIATQNARHQLGTHPLPESQLDRFLMCISLGYPDERSERELLMGQDRRDLVARMSPMMSPDDLQAAQALVRSIHAAPALIDYLQALLAATRNGRWFVEGLSPRAALAILRAARAKALLEGRDHVAPDDLQAILVPCARHRLVPGSGSGRGPAEQIQALIEAVALP